jgi:hypothetical protein
MDLTIEFNQAAFTHHIGGKDICFAISTAARYDAAIDEDESDNKHLIMIRGMTEEEAFALDKKWTETTPKAGPNGSGFIAKRKAAQNIARVIAIEGPSYDYLFAKAIAVHKTPAELIRNMAQERIAAHD